VETANEALERYYREESSSMGGLFTPGGASAGGIFGDGQISTDQFDGAAAHRQLSAVRSAGMGSVKRQLAASQRREAQLLKRIEKLEQRQLGPGKKRGRRDQDEEDDDLDELDDEFEDDFDDDDFDED
jgi:hypothetical protein